MITFLVDETINILPLDGVFCNIKVMKEMILSINRKFSRKLISKAKTLDR